jgi:signal transduction histidine kinase
MRALGTLAAGIAHDFNNLLSIIRMANQLTTREAGSNPDVKENSQVIEEAVRQGKDVVKSMLGYSRKNESGPQWVTIAELVEDLVPLLSKQFLSGITLKLELGYDLPRVKTVPQRLEQILLNLIVNASEALEGQGRLTIRTQLAKIIPERMALRSPGAGDFVRVSVIDNGPGIPVEIEDRIFEPFFSTKNTGANRGTGLGLSIVYTIAEEEGYGIDVENSPGQGAAFHIYVPVDMVPGGKRNQSEVVSSG